MGITDGDTFTFLTSDKKQVKVRLAEIDAPERAQPYGSRARPALADLIFEKEVWVLTADTDRYGRLVGQVYVGNLHVNWQKVGEGMLWEYLQYQGDKKRLQAHS